MAHAAALQSLSSASCSFIGQQPRRSFASVSLKVNALPVRTRICNVRGVIRSHLDDLHPKESDQIRKNEELKRLRKLRKERRAKRNAEELAKIPQVKPDPALDKFERPLRNWNKPWKKKEVLVKKASTGGRHQGLGFEQGARWVRNATAEASSSSRRNGDLEDSESSWREFEDQMRQNYTDDSEPTVVHRATVGDKYYSNSEVNGENAARRRNGNVSQVTGERENAGKGAHRQASRIVIGQRKGADVYLAIGDEDASVKKQISRSDLDEEKQLEWLAKQ